MGLRNRELLNFLDLERKRKRILIERKKEISFSKASERDPKAIEAYDNKIQEMDREIKSSQISLDSYDKVNKDVNDRFEKRQHRYRILKGAENAVEVLMSSLILASILIMIFMPAIDSYVRLANVLFAIGVGLLVVRIYLHHVEID